MYQCVTENLLIFAFTGGQAALEDVNANKKVFFVTTVPCLMSKENVKGIEVIN